MTLGCDAGTLESGLLLLLGDKDCYDTALCGPGGLFASCSVKLEQDAACQILPFYRGISSPGAVRILLLLKSKIIVSLGVLRLDSVGFLD